jgi:hypothetical protein
MRLVDEVADGGTRPPEAGPAILRACADRRGEHGIRSLAGRPLRPPKRLLAGQDGHGGDGLGELAKVPLAPRLMLADGDEPFRLGQSPPHTQLGLARAGAATAFHDQHRRAEVPDRATELRRDVAGIKVDHGELHLLDVLGAGLAVRGDGAGDDVDRAALVHRPGGIGAEGLHSTAIGGSQMLCDRVSLPWPWSRSRGPGSAPRNSRTPSREGRDGAMVDGEALLLPG